MSCLRSKLGTGYVPFPEPTGNPASPKELTGVLDNLNLDNPATDIGRSWLPSPPRKPWRSSRVRYAKLRTVSPPDPLLPRLMSGRKTLETESLSSSEKDSFDGIVLPIGQELKNLQSQVHSIWSHRTYSYGIIGHLSQLQPIMTILSAWKRVSPYILVELDPANPTERTMKLGLTPILRIRVASSGVATAVNILNIGEPHIIIDEFRGGIDISHMLRWLDRYPVRVELKGSSAPLKATKIWITSNLHPLNWYPDLDHETKQALLRRVEITEFE